jgi:lantibiotic leader peptide-processing serine protease
MHRVVRITAALIVTLAMALAASLGTTPARAGTVETYLVLYKAEAVPADAASKIATAGGTLVAGYNAIGVAVARSGSAAFRSNLLQDKRVEGVMATTGFGVGLGDAALNQDASGVLPNVPVSDSDTFSPLQWDMRQIMAPEAHAITGGSPSVLVGDIDTGMDYQHPDLVPNLDFANSVSCVGGVPNQDPAAWNDDNGHGTHTAGTIAAASNGIGIVGVAPNVRIAAIKVSTPAGFFFPEAVVCGFMWAADHGFDVTNNSYFADPFQFNCHNDPEQQAIWKAETRAIRYAMNKGVTVVASSGNSNFDLTIHPPEGNQCVRVPSEVSGVITVSANGNLREKSFYSNYGNGIVEVVAPGGDSLFQLTAEAPNGRVLSTWPAAFSGLSFVISDPAAPGAYYRYVQGTSMATPHVTGVAALIISQNGNINPGAVKARIGQTADSIDCPANPFRAGTAFEATCRGGAGHNSFYGHGQVNAYNAVTR